MFRVLIFSALLFQFISNTKTEILLRAGKNGVSLKFLEDDESDKYLDEDDAKPRLSSTEIYSNLKRRLETIRKSCGQVCDTSVKGSPGKYYDVLRKDVDCQSLFTNPDIDAPGEFPQPPKKIPKYLLEDFSYNGQLKMMNFYRNDANGITHKIEWTMKMINHFMTLYDNKELPGNYGPEVVKYIDAYLDEFIPIKDQHVLVIGSQSPWIETMLLAKGAKFVTTFDYVKIKSEHPQLEVLTPEELSQKFLKENVQYDSMVTFSSLEHSGLGRYGDMLNPWGDLITMARAWCLIKPGGRALVGVPSGPDIVMFNSHRLYGPTAYSHLFANWGQIFTDNDFRQFNRSGCDSCYQPLHIIEKLIIL